MVHLSETSHLKLAVGDNLKYMTCRNFLKTNVNIVTKREIHFYDFKDIIRIHFLLLHLIQNKMFYAYIRLYVVFHLRRKIIVCHFFQILLLLLLSQFKCVSETLL